MWRHFSAMPAYRKPTAARSTTFSVMRWPSGFDTENTYEDAASGRKDNRPRLAGLPESAPGADISTGNTNKTWQREPVGALPKDHAENSRCQFILVLKQYRGIVHRAVEDMDDHNLFAFNTVENQVAAINPAANAVLFISTHQRRALWSLG